MISVYIHIPFCTNICTYCDFCKVYKNDEWIDKYLECLNNEILDNYKGEKIKTLYIGGGTPSSLNLLQLERLFEIVSVFDLCDDAEISFEANCEDLTDEKLTFLSQNINRLSIGVQSFNNDILKVIGRTSNYDSVKKALNYFSNVNVDLMYGFNEEDEKILRDDLNKIINLGVHHISTYSLILEPNTMLYIKGYKTNNDIMYEDIINYVLKKNGYIHYEVSNYAKKGYESKHNLVYWNNKEYYGFGMGASGYISGVRYDNTRSINKYLNGKYRSVSNILSKNEILENEFILGFRKVRGISKKDFFDKYNFDIRSVSALNDLILEGYLCDDGNNVFIPSKYFYLSNEILVKFLDLKVY